MILALLREDPHLGYSQMLRKYRGLVGAIIGRILPGYQQDAEECIADTFIQIWKGAVQNRVDGSLMKGLLICTARNTAINRYWKIKRTRTVPYSDEMEFPYPDDALNDLIAEEEASALQALINKLPEPDKEILTRRYFLFEPVKDIARIMKLPARQIENRLYQSKRRLRKALGERRTADG